MHNEVVKPDLTLRRALTAEAPMLCPRMCRAE